MEIKVLDKTHIEPSLQNQISKLFKQLSPDKTQQSLDKLCSQGNPLTLVCCIENDQIIGMASMGVYTVISGKKGWIEDVVVDKEQRAKGIGRKLIEKLISIGKQMELTEILLFTEDHRIPAIRLYSDLGFKVKDSRIYNLKFR